MIPDDQEEITKIDRRMQRNEKFLSILPTKGPTAYQEFVKALEVNQSFLACKLLREELKVVEAKCNDLENRLKGKQEALNKSSITKHRERKTKYIKKKKKYARENLGTIAMKVATTGVTTKKTSRQLNKQQERMRCYAKIEVEKFPLTTYVELQNYSSHLSLKCNVELRDKRQGSLILTAHCRTLEILERLWEDYCSGHLDTVAEECLLTGEIKEEMGEKRADDADIVGLETTILKEDYLRCKKYLTELSGLNSLKDEESVAMENIKYKNILLKFYVLLLEKLDSNEVSRQLLTAGVLTSDDKEKIEERPSQKEKNEELLMMLATKGARAYEEFVKALEKDQCFLACQLLKEEKERLLYEVMESEWLLDETVNELLMAEEKAITAAKENDKLKAQLEEAKTSVQRKKAVTLVEIAEIMEDLEGSWEELATVLELGEENLHKIRKENETDRQKAYAVLTMWMDEEGEDATMGRLLDTIVKIAKRSPVKKTLESDELVDDQGEVNRLLKKSMDEISVENRKKRASGENSVDAVLKELGVQLPEEEDEDEQKEVAKLLKEVYDGISVKNRKKEGRKTSLEAAFKEPNTQPQEASSPGEKKPTRKGSKKKALAS